MDQLGSLDDAIALALSRVGLARQDAEVRRAEPGLGEALAASLANARAGPLEKALESVPEVRALAALSEMGPVLALPMEWVEPVR